jgi:hypothetical protein
VARSLGEAPNGAVQASVWERDQQAWNLPRAAAAPIAHGAYDGEHGTGEGDPGEQGAERPAMPPKATE